MKRAVRSYSEPEHLLTISDRDVAKLLRDAKDVLQHRGYSVSFDFEDDEICIYKTTTERL